MAEGEDKEQAPAEASKEEDEEVHEKTIWFTKRAIRYWLYNKMTQEPYEIWNIDDYDGGQDYQEWQLKLPAPLHVQVEILGVS